MYERVFKACLSLMNLSIRARHLGLRTASTVPVYIIASVRYLQVKCGRGAVYMSKARKTDVIACPVARVMRCLMTVTRSRDPCGGRVLCSTW